MPIFRKDGRNILFIHIPKTGGSSIENAFRKSGYAIDYLDGNFSEHSLNRLRRCTPQHMHGRMLKQNFKLWRFDLIFMFVRDPIARFRSEYLWRNRTKEISLEPTRIEKWADKSFAKYRRDHFLYDNHFRPQSDFSVKGVQVYHFENGLANAIADLGSRHGLELPTEVPRVRQGKTESGFSSKDVTITPALHRRIKRFYRRDFSRFGYDATGAVR